MSASPTTRLRGLAQQVRATEDHVRAHLGGHADLAPGARVTTTQKVDAAQAVGDGLDASSSE